MEALSPGWIICLTKYKNSNIVEDPWDSSIPFQRPPSGQQEKFIFFLLRWPEPYFQQMNDSGLIMLRECSSSIPGLRSRGSGVDTLGRTPAQVPFTDPLAWDPSMLQNALLLPSRPGRQAVIQACAAINSVFIFTLSRAWNGDWLGTQHRGTLGPVSPRTSSFHQSRYLEVFAGLNWLSKEW